MAEQPLNSKNNSLSASDKSAEKSLREQHLRLSGSPDVLPRIREAVVDAAKRCGLNDDEIGKFEMAVGEACTNIIEHAYGDHPSPPEIQVDIHEFANRIEITILDYSTINFPVDEALGLSIEQYIGGERRRGLGLFIIHNFVDRIEHRFISDQGNELRLVKYLA